MAKLTLSDIANALNDNSAVATVNANSALIETALENTLSRDGTTPNTMSANLDMNSNRIVNLGAPISNTDAVRLIDVIEVESTLLDGVYFRVDNNLSEVIDASAARSNLELDAVTNDAQTKASIVPNTAPTAGDILIGNASGAYEKRSVTGDVTVSSSGVTAIGATKVTNSMLAGSIPSSKLVGSDIDTVGTITTGTWNAGAVTSSGTVAGTLFSGSGASLTNLPAANLTGTLPAISGASLTNLNASNLASGTVPDARFPATLPAISGASLTNLNASNLASGTVATARLGSGTANDTVFLRGDGVWSNTITNTSSGAVTNAVHLTNNSSGVLASGTRLYLSGSGSTARSVYIEGVNANGAGNAHDLIIGTSASTTAPIERVRITNTGNLGVGANPLNKLDVAGAVAIGSGYAGVYTAPTNGMLVQGVVGINNPSPIETIDVIGSANFSNVYIVSDSTSGAGTIGFKTSANGPRIQFWGSSTANPNKMYLQAGGAVRAVIDGQTGYVCVGNTVPVHKLDVRGNIGIIASGYLNWGDSDGTSGYGIRDNAGVMEYKGSGGSWSPIGGGGGGGTVTSVGLSLPAELSVTVSPITTNGSLTATWANQSANIVFAGPSSGGAATPAFRALVVNDLPGSIPASKLVGTDIATVGTITSGIWNAGAVTSSGTITGTHSGNGAALTSLNASNLASGTVPDARFPATLPAASGVNLTSLNASNLASGTVPDARFPATLPAASGVNLTALNASNLASGTVPDARFPATLPAASGVNLTSLNATNLASGTVPTARLGSGTATASKFLRGDQQWIQVAPWIDVKADYGAVGDGSTDDTTAINNAIAAANAATYTPSIFFPQGNYKITATLTTITKPVIIRGSGINATTITVSNPNYDVFKFIKGSAGRIFGGGVRDLTITGTGTRSSGYAITVDYFGNFDVSDVRITNIYNGIYARQYNDLRIHKTYIGPIYGLYGLRLYGDGSTRNGETDRSDVLNAVNLVIDGNLQNANTEGVRIDGYIHTVQGHSFQVLGCKRGLYVTNTPASTAPSFIIISDYESENCTDECIRVNCAGESFWFNNLYCVGTTGVQVSTGLVYFEGGATDIKLNVGRIAGGYNYGLICDGVDFVDVTDVDIYNNSRQTSNAYDGIYLGNAAVPRFTMKGGMSKGANQRYGLHIVNVSGTRVALAGPDFTGNVTAGRYDPGSKVLSGSFNW